MNNCFSTLKNQLFLFLLVILFLCAGEYVVQGRHVYSLHGESRWTQGGGRMWAAWTQNMGHNVGALQVGHRHISGGQCSNSMS